MAARRKTLSIGTLMTSPQHDDTMLERIRRLLVKAERASTEHERDAYNGKAAELLAKYGIDEALIAAEDPNSHLPGDRRIDIDDPYARQKIWLIGAVAAALRCRAVHQKARDPQRPKRLMHRIHLFGMPADLERVEVLYTSLMVQMAMWGGVARPQPTEEEQMVAAISCALAGDHARNWRNHLPADIRISGDQLSAFRRSWMLGFAGRIEQRIREAEEAALARRQADEQAYSGPAKPGAQLVLMSQAERVDAALAKVYPRLKTSRNSYSNNRGYHAGAVAANRADLGGARIGQTAARKAIR